MWKLTGDSLLPMQNVQYSIGYDCEQERSADKRKSYNEGEYTTLYKQGVKAS